MIIRLSLYILGCVLGCKHHNNLIINLICGAGGARTLVQTGKQHAFYTLIVDLIFVFGQDQRHQPKPYPLKFHLDCKTGQDYPRFICTT